jgi:hypothetical protein
MSDLMHVTGKLLSLYNTSGALIISLILRFLFHGMDVAFPEVNE